MFLRDHGVYYVIRELDKEEESDAIHDIIQKIVDLLIRDEE